MDGFGKLLEHEIPRLRRYARALTRDATRADDLVQSCLVRALAKSHLWQPGTDLRAWIGRASPELTVQHREHGRKNDARLSLRASDRLEVGYVLRRLSTNQIQRVFPGRNHARSTRH